MKSKLIILALILFMALTSCSARKVNKSKTEIKSETKTEIATEAEVKTDVKTETETKVDADVVVEEYEIEPIDTSKPIEITDPTGKKTVVKNGKISTKKTTDKTKSETSATTIDKSISSDKTDVQIKHKEESDNDTKVVIKDEPGKTLAITSIIWGIFFLVLVVAIILWYVGILRKKKFNT